ncbi:MAG: enolase C-terminal domain-like protein, partial [Clostridium sp.]
HLIEEYMKPLLVGRPVENIEETWQLMHQNGYWRNGPIENNAISGIDMALWDIKGKMAGMPLYELFGGKVREGIPVYRHVDGRDINEICENIQMYQEMGITHLRCQCGGYGGLPYGQTPETAPEGAHDGLYLDSKKYIRDTIQLFEQIRAKIGYDMQLVHDVHERIAPADAVALAKGLEPFDLFFLEDPVPLEQLSWLRNLRQQTSIPIAQGHSTIRMNENRDRRAAHRFHPCSYQPGWRVHRRARVFAEQLVFGQHGTDRDMSPLAHAANIHIDPRHNFGVQEWSGIEPKTVIQ